MLQIVAHVYYYCYCNNYLIIHKHTHLCITNLAPLGTMIIPTQCRPNITNTIVLLKIFYSNIFNNILIFLKAFSFFLFMWPHFIQHV